MTAQVTEPRTANTVRARDTVEDRSAVLRMLREDAAAYLTGLFDWLDSGEPGTGMILIHACFSAKEKNFYEVLAALIADAEGAGFSREHVCSETRSCQCLHCRYPAEAEEDPRAPWTQLMDNVRQLSRQAAAYRQL